MDDISETDIRKRSAALILAILSAKSEAGQLGLWKTMHALDDASSAIGWEVADRVNSMPENP
jgi:phage gp36-like protein